MQNSALTGSLAASAVLLLATGYGLWRGQRDGRLRRTGTALEAGPGRTGSGADRDNNPVDVQPVEPAVLALLGITSGPEVTLLQFSSAFCAPCRATRRVLGEVAGLLDGVRHIEVDAESRLEVVRALDIWRTPTTLVLDRSGRIAARATGVPSKPQVIATVAALLTGGEAVPNPDHRTP